MKIKLSRKIVRCLSDDYCVVIRLHTTPAFFNVVQGFSPTDTADLKVCTSLSDDRWRIFVSAAIAADSPGCKNRECHFYALVSLSKVLSAKFSKKYTGDGNQGQICQFKTSCSNCAGLIITKVDKKYPDYGIQ
ncbi:MAG: hypothetical protein ACXWME_05530 [Syntrophales bacterium]